MQGKYTCVRSLLLAALCLSYAAVSAGSGVQVISSQAGAAKNNQSTAALTCASLTSTFSNFSASCDYCTDIDLGGNCTFSLTVPANSLGVLAIDRYTGTITPTLRFCAGSTTSCATAVSPDIEAINGGSFSDVALMNAQANRADFTLTVSKHTANACRGACGESHESSYHVFACLQITRDNTFAEVSDFRVYSGYSLSCPGSWVQQFPDDGENRCAAAFFKNTETSRTCCCPSGSTMSLSGVGYQPPSPRTFTCKPIPQESSAVPIGAVIGGLVAAGGLVSAASQGASHMGFNFKNTAKQVIKKTSSGVKQVAKKSAAKSTSTTAPKGGVATSQVGGVSQGAGALPAQCPSPTSSMPGGAATAEADGGADAASGGKPPNEQQDTLPLDRTADVANLTRVFEELPRSAWRHEAGLADISGWMWLAFYMCRVMDSIWDVAKDLIPVPIDDLPLTNLIEPLLLWRAYSDYITIRVKVASLVVDRRNLCLDLSLAEYAKLHLLSMGCRLMTLGISEFLSFLVAPEHACSKALDFSKGYVNSVLDSRLRFVDSAKLTQPPARNQQGFVFFRASPGMLLGMKSKALGLLTAKQSHAAYQAEIASIRDKVQKMRFGGYRPTLTIAGEKASTALYSAYRRVLDSEDFMRKVDACIQWSKPTSFSEISAQQPSLVIRNPLHQSDSMPTGTIAEDPPNV